MSWRAAHSGNEAWKFLHLNKIRTYQQVPDLSWLQQIQSWDLLLKITWHQKLPKLARKLQEATSVYGSTSHEGPQRGLCLSALIKSIPFSLFSFFFWYLIENWASVLPMIAIKWWMHCIVGVLTDLALGNCESCWVSVDCLLLIH